MWPVAEAMRLVWERRPAGPLRVEPGMAADFSLTARSARRGQCAGEVPGTPRAEWANVPCTQEPNEWHVRTRRLGTRRPKSPILKINCGVRRIRPAALAAVSPRPVPEWNVLRATAEDPCTERSTRGLEAQNGPLDDGGIGSRTTARSSSSPASWCVRRSERSTRGLEAAPVRPPDRQDRPALGLHRMFHSRTPDRRRVGAGVLTLATHRSTDAPPCQ